MTKIIQRLEGEAIVVVTFNGVLGAEQLIEFGPEAAQMQREASIPLYWIIDVRETISDFGQIMKMLVLQSKRTPGTAANAPERVFLVGSAQMTRLYVDAMRQPQFGGMDIPMFPKLENALAAVRIRVHSGD